MGEQLGQLFGMLTGGIPRFISARTKLAWTMHCSEEAALSPPSLPSCDSGGRRLCQLNTSRTPWILLTVCLQINYHN